MVELQLKMMAVWIGVTVEGTPNLAEMQARRKKILNRT